MLLADCSARYLAGQEALEEVRRGLNAIGAVAVSPQLAIGLYQLGRSAGPVQVSHWAANWGGGNVSYNVIKAEELGLIVSSRSEADRRIKPLVLTEAGRDLVGRLERQLASHGQTGARLEALTW